MAKKNVIKQVSPSRRTVLRSISAIGVGSTMGIGTAAANRESATELEDAIIGINALRSSVGAILGNEEITGLSAHLRKRGYRPRIADTIGIPVPIDDIETAIPADYPDFDPEAFAVTSPITAFLPYENDHGDIALLVVLLAADPNSNGNAKAPVAVMGLVDSESDGAGSENVTASRSRGGVDVLGFAEPPSDDTGRRDVAIIDEWNSDTGVSVQYEGFGCLALVLELCRRWGTGATVTQCGNVCLRTATPWFVAGCGSFCVGLVLIINRYGCNETGAVICAAATAD